MQKFAIQIMLFQIIDIIIEYLIEYYQEIKKKLPSLDRWGVIKVKAKNSIHNGS
jgi:hypothetical protein